MANLQEETERAREKARGVEAGEEERRARARGRKERRGPNEKRQLQNLQVEAKLEQLTTSERLKKREHYRQINTGNNNTDFLQ